MVYAGARCLVRSQLGLVLAGMRQNEERLAFFGYRVQLFKALVFSLAGMIAGLGGALYSYHQGFIGPGNMGPGLSTTAVIYCLFGGSGTLIGPVLGTAAVEVLVYVLADIDAIKQFWPVILGLVLLAVVMFQPKGIARPDCVGPRAHRLLRPAPAQGVTMALLEIPGVCQVVTHAAGARRRRHRRRGRHVPWPDRSQRLGQEHPAEGDRRRPLRRPPAPSCSTAATSPARRPIERARAGLSLKFQITAVLTGALGLRQRAAGAAIGREPVEPAVARPSRRALRRRGERPARALPADRPRR